MNICPNCGKMAGLHGSVLQGCMCQYSMQAPAMREGKDFTISKPWVGLTAGEIAIIVKMLEKGNFFVAIAAIEAKLKEKNT